MKKILLVGSLNMDQVLTVDHHPLPGETILGDSLVYSPGGKGANQAYAVGRLGGNIQMIGCVGQDDNGRALLANLQKAGVDTSTVAQLEGVPTGLAVIPVDAKGENSIIVISGANFKLTPELIDASESVIAESDYVMTQLETPLETVIRLAELAKKHDKFFILDPAPARKDIPDSLLAMVDLTKPNETELQILTGMPTETEEEVIAAAKVLVGRGVKNVVASMGSKGAFLVNAETEAFFPAHKVKAVDTTAAGDAFTAAMVNGLSEGMTLPDAIMYAHTISSIVVQRKGAQTSIPDKEEARAVLEQMKK